jgi:hypothetical protein
VYVKRADGTLAVFRVTAVQSYAKDQFPTLAVYGPTPGAELRLITCGGTFDPALGSYLSNTVVYAVQVSRALSLLPGRASARVVRSRRVPDNAGPGRARCG